MEYILKVKWCAILVKISLVKQIRLTCARFSHWGTVYSVSLSLLYGLSEWKRLLYFSLWMIRLDEPINVKSVKSQFTKVIIQDEGRKMMAATNFGSISIKQRK